MEEGEKVGILKRLLRRKKLITVVVVILSAIFGYRYYSSRNTDGLDEAKVERGKVTEDLILTGEINADDYVNMRFPVSGEIAWVGVAEGDEVKKGTALVKLDTTNLNSTYEQALSDLRAEEANVEKIHDDVKDHDSDETFTQKVTRTDAEVAKDKAYEAVIKARENLKNATLIAPFDGIVSSLAHSFSGINVLSTESQVELINPDTIYFDVTADQSEVFDISEGQKVEVVLDTYTGDSLTGVVNFISLTPREGEVGSTYKAKVTFDKKVDLSKIKIGMTGDAKFLLNEKDNVLYIPPKFVHSDGEGKYLLKNTKNNKVYVEIGLEGEDRVEIKSADLKEGDIVYD